MAGSVFDIEGEDRVESPERLNEYIHVANPGMWTMLVALFLVAISVVVWGMIGRIPESVAFKGVVDCTMGYTIDVVVDASKYSGMSLVGKEARFRFPDGSKGAGVITKSSEVPLSRDEMDELLESDFLSAALVDADYSYVVFVQPNGDITSHDLEIADVTIITREIKPIEYLLR